MNRELFSLIKELSGLIRGSAQNLMIRMLGGGGARPTIHETGDRGASSIIRAPFGAQAAKARSPRQQLRISEAIPLAAGLTRMRCGVFQCLQAVIARNSSFGLVSSGLIRRSDLVLLGSANHGNSGSVEGVVRRQRRGGRKLAYLSSRRGYLLNHANGSRGYWAGELED